jgi:hypothetical protein
MGVSVLSVTYVLNIKAEEILTYAYKYTLTARQRVRIVTVKARLILQILTGDAGKSFQHYFVASPVKTPSNISRI